MALRSPAWSPLHQIAEIKSSAALRLYGAALAAITTASCLHWLLPPSLSDVLATGSPAVCWPFLESCYAWRIFSPLAITSLVSALLVLSLVTCSTFIATNKVTLAYWLLVSITLLKAIIVLQDFRLTLNHHYMALWLTSVYILMPSKIRSLRLLIVFMYLWAGVIKIDPGSQWLTGTTFYYGSAPFGMPHSLLPAARVYVVVLELIVSWGLLAGAPVLWVALGQFVMFHISSFWVVGWFYPVMMFLALMIFPLNAVFKPAAGEGPSPKPRRTWMPAVAVVIAFSAAQVPRYVFPGDSSLTGEGRLFALNMFDAPVECRATVTIVGGGQATQTLPIDPRFVNTRTMCDPLVFYGLATDYCRDLHKQPLVRDLDLHLEARKEGQRGYMSLIDIHSFCDLKPTYAVFRHNPWILARPGEGFRTP